MVDLLFPFWDGLLAVLCALSVEDSVLEVPLITQLVVAEVELAKALHLALMPLPDVLLPVLVVVDPLAVSHLPSALLLPSHRAQVSPVAHLPIRIGVPHSLLDGDHPSVGLLERLRVVGGRQTHVLSSYACPGAQEGLDEVDELGLLQDLWQWLYHFFHLLLDFLLVQQGCVDLPGHHVQLLYPVVQRPKGQSLGLVGVQQFLDHVQQLVGVLVAAEADQLLYLVVVDDAVAVVVELVRVAHGDQRQHHHPEAEGVADPVDLVVPVRPLECCQFLGAEEDVGGLVVAAHDLVVAGVVEEPRVGHLDVVAVVAEVYVLHPHRAVPAQLESQQSPRGLPHYGADLGLTELATLGPPVQPLLLQVEHDEVAAEVQLPSQPAEALILDVLHHVDLDHVAVVGAVPAAPDLLELLHSLLVVPAVGDVLADEDAVVVVVGPLQGVGVPVVGVPVERHVPVLAQELQQSGGMALDSQAAVGLCQCLPQPVHALVKGTPLVAHLNRIRQQHQSSSVSLSNTSPSSSPAHSSYSAGSSGGVGWSLLSSSNWQRLSCKGSRSRCPLRGGVSCLGGGKRGSRARRKVCSSNCPISLASRLQLVSRQGLVLISISLGFWSSSSMKSIPSSSKLCYGLRPASSPQQALTATSAISFISSSTFSQLLPSTSFRYSANSPQLTLFPFSYLPYYPPLLCTASLVRCTIWSEGVRMEQLTDAVLRQPQGNQQALKTPFVQVSSRKWRISNFLPRYSIGLSMYFCTIKVRTDPSLFLYRPPSRLLISPKVWQTLMPVPWLEFSPGLTIHRLPLLPLLFWDSAKWCCRKFWCSLS